MEHYFRLLGDVGYLCDTLDEMSDLIEQLLHEKPTARYNQQVRNILAGRSLFDPAALAPRLKQAALSAHFESRGA
jgi:hypothetical protein